MINICRILLTIFFLIGISSCNNEEVKHLNEEIRKLEKDKEILNQRIDELENKNINLGYDLRKLELENKSKKNTKHVYAVFEVLIPELNHSPAFYGIGTKQKASNFVTHFSKTFATSIETIKNFDNDSKHRFLDSASDMIKQKLLAFDGEFTSDLFMKASQDKDYKKMSKRRSKITNKSVRVFDSYQEASIDRVNQGFN